MTMIHYNIDATFYWLVGWGFLLGVIVTCAIIGLLIWFGADEDDWDAEMEWETFDQWLMESLEAGMLPRAEEMEARRRTEKRLFNNPNRDFVARRRRRG